MSTITLIISLGGFESTMLFRTQGSGKRIRNKTIQIILFNL